MLAVGQLSFLFLNSDTKGDFQNKIFPETTFIMNQNWVKRHDFSGFAQNVI